MKSAHRKRGIASAVILGAAPLGIAVLPTAQAAAPPFALTTSANGGIPALVKPAADLAAQPPGPEGTWVDSIFVAGRVRGAGHNFGILIHTLRFPNGDERKLSISVTDTSTGWYRTYTALIPKDKYTWSRKSLHIRMPGLTWTGSARQMRVKTKTPWGSLDARFTPTGPVLNYTGDGLAVLLGDVNYEYAFPTMRTTGTLTAEGGSRRVSGISWLDRQWGPLPLDHPAPRWTWMNIALSNRDQIALWDILDKRTENAWVTVLRPDGSYDLATVRPLARGASSFWTSPVTHQTYPMRWRIDIPALRAHLNVAVTRPRGQEFPDGHVEATANVIGIYKGRRVTGTTYVEMTGDWKSPR